MTEKIIREWERRDDETEEEFTWFDAYRETRNRAEVIRRHFPGMNETAARALLNRTGRRHKWDARLLAYDRWIARQRDDAVAAMVRHEIGLIERKRARIIHVLTDKVMQVVKNADASKSSRSVDNALRLAGRLQDVFDKMKLSAPGAGDAESGTSSAVDSSRARLLRDMQDIAAKQQQAEGQKAFDQNQPPVQ